MSAEDIEYMGDYKEFPTKESALDWLDNYLSLDERNNLIRALQQEPILDKIREQIKSDLRGVEIALEVLAENHPLRQKMEGAKDTLVDCLELIDKAETEAEDGECK